MRVHFVRLTQFDTSLIESEERRMALEGGPTMAALKFPPRELWLVECAGDGCCVCAGNPGTHGATFDTGELTLPASMS